MFNTIDNGENTNNNEYYAYYTIKKGDNLYQIAKRFNVNPALLAALNGLNNNDYIYPDQIIMIPRDNYAYYITKDGDTLNLVAEAFNTDPSNLINYNNAIYLKEGQLIVNRINL